MTKHKSEGLMNKLRETKIRKGIRFLELEKKAHKTPLEWEEFHILKHETR